MKLKAWKGCFPYRTSALTPDYIGYELKIQGIKDSQNGSDSMDNVKKNRWVWKPGSAIFLWGFLWIS